MLQKVGKIVFKRCGTGRAGGFPCLPADGRWGEEWGEVQKPFVIP